MFETTMARFYTQDQTIDVAFPPDEEWKNVVSEAKRLAGEGAVFFPCVLVQARNGDVRVLAFGGYTMSISSVFMDYVRLWREQF